MKLSRIIKFRLIFFKRLYERFIRIRGTPREIALGFSMGVFLGLTPTMGFQIVIAIFLAALLKWNKISATLGVFITNPLTAPFIYGATYIVGSRFLKIEKTFVIPKELSIDVAMSMLEQTPKIFAAMTIGGIIIGIPLAIISYICIYMFTTYSQNKFKQKVHRRKKSA